MATLSFIKVLRRNVSVRSKRGAMYVETSIGIAFFLFLVWCLISILWASYHLVVAQYLATVAVREITVLPGGGDPYYGPHYREHDVVQAILCNNPNPPLNRLCSKNFALDLSKNLGKPGIPPAGAGCGSIGAPYGICVDYYDENLKSWNQPGAGTAGQFVRVRIYIESSIFKLVPDILNRINMGDALQYNQLFILSGSAVGRNESIVDQ